METSTKKQGFVITIGARLLIGFMALSLPLLILIILLLPKVNDVIELTHKIHSKNLPPILDSQIYQAQDILEHWAMTGDPKDKVYVAHIWNEITHVRDQWDRVIRKLDDPKLRHEWSKLQELYLPFYQAQASVLNASRDPNNPDNVENSRNKTRAFEKSMINIIDGPYYEETGKRTGGLFSDLAREIEKNVNTIDKQPNFLKKISLLATHFSHCFNPCCALHNPTSHSNSSG